MQADYHSRFHEALSAGTRSAGFLGACTARQGGGSRGGLKGRMKGGDEGGGWMDGWMDGRVSNERADKNSN